MDFRVPEEVWTSVMPSLDDLKRFGCLAYVHSSEGKLEPRAKRGVFTVYPVYPEGVKGYRVWLIEEDKYVISKNIVFREYVVYKGIKSETQSGMDPYLANKILGFDIAGKYRESEVASQGEAYEDARVQQMQSSDT